MKKLVTKTFTITLSEQEATDLKSWIDYNGFTDFGILEEIRDFLAVELKNDPDNDDDEQ